MVHHALGDEEGRQSAGRSTGTVGCGVSLHCFGNYVPVWYVVG